MSEYIKGDYTKCYEDICEIWYEDNLYCIVRTDDADKLIDVLNENEQLKSEIAKLSYANEDLLTEKRNWFVLSNEYGELYDKHEKKKEHQRVLENKIHRMRKSIHKLEWLASHRNADLIRENEQLKSEIKDLNDVLARYEEKELQ